MAQVSLDLPSPGDDRGEGEEALSAAVLKLLNEFGYSGTGGDSTGRISNDNLIATARIALTQLAGGVSYVGYKAIDTQETVASDSLVAATTPDRLSDVVIANDKSLLIVAYEGMLEPASVPGAVSYGLNMVLHLDGVSLKAYDIHNGDLNVQAFGAPEQQFENDVWQPYGSDAEIGMYGYPMTPTDYAGDSGPHIAGAGTLTGYDGTGFIPIYADAGTYDIEVRYEATSKDGGGFNTARNLKIKNRRLYAIVLKPGS